MSTFHQYGMDAYLIADDSELLDYVGFQQELQSANIFSLIRTTEDKSKFNGLELAADAAQAFYEKGITEVHIGKLGNRFVRYFLHGVEKQQLPDVQVNNSTNTVYLKK